MKVSIIIPAHNEEKSIARTLQAVLALDYPDFEVIVVDNASSDTTADIIKNFSTIKLVTETKKGTQYAREAGRKGATGEFIAFIDADCIPDPQWLNNGMRLLTTKKAVAVSGPYNYYDASFIFKILSNILQQVIYVSVNNILYFFGLGGIVIGGNVIVSSHALHDLGGLNTAISFYGDDTDLAKKLSKQGRVIFSQHFVIKSSARRFKRSGSLKVFYLYFMNFMWVICFDKPYGNR